MKTVKGHNFKTGEVIPYEHLEFVVRNTTPYQRLKGLESAWLLWRAVRKNLPERIVKFQDKFRQGKM